MPGYADCRIYRVIRDYPEAEPRLDYLPDQDRTVYNISHERVGGNRWVHVARDKFGRWHALTPSPAPSADDPTGAPDAYGPGFTGTGTGGLGGHILSVFFPPDPAGCTGGETVYVEESDVFCEPGATTILRTLGGLGTGTGTHTPVTNLYYLNLYRRKVYLAIDLLTGCLARAAGPWNFVRTVGCCDPTCTEPDTGTGAPPGAAAACCAHGTLSELINWELSGPTLPSCRTHTFTGIMQQTAPPGGYEWTGSGSYTSGVGNGYVNLVLYCSGTTWRARGTIRRYLAGVEDTTTPFDVALAFQSLGPGLTVYNTLVGTVPGPSGCGANYGITIDNPCSSWDCVAGNCVEMADNLGAYATLAACQAACPAAVPGTHTCGACTDIADTLTLTMSFANCACEDTTLTLTWDSGNSDWRTSFTEGCVGGGSNLIALRCDAGVFKLRTVTGTCVSLPEEAMTVDNCEPLQLSLTTTNTPGGGCGSCTAGAATYIITE